jgi:hypothetical protein
MGCTARCQPGWAKAKAKRNLAACHYCSGLATATPGSDSDGPHIGDSVELDDVVAPALE